MLRLLALALLATSALAQDLIVGHATHDSVRINVTTAAAAKGELMIGDRTQAYETTAASARRAIVTFTGLAPRTAYEVRIGDKVGATFRTMPKPGQTAPLRIGFGSCLAAQAPRVAEVRADGRTVIDNFQILPHLAKEKLDAFLWIGDRYYGPGLYEHYGKANAAQVREVYWKLHDMLVALPDVKKLLRQTPNYVIWDDHDYGPDNAAKDFKFKEISFEVLARGFANPPMGEKDNRGGYFKLTCGAVDLFLLDNRWHRDCAGLVKTLPDGKQVHSCTPVVKKQPDGTFLAEKPLEHIYGARQMAWLKAGLLASKATFKLVVGGGQHLSNIHRFEAWYHCKERAAFLAWLSEKKVPGVVFVSGDRHHPEIGVLKTGGPYPLYEITSSGLGVTVYPLDDDKPESPYDVLVGKGSIHNYGLIEFDPKDGGTLTLILKEKSGAEIGRRAIKRAELEAR